MGVVDQVNVPKGLDYVVAAPHKGSSHKSSHFFTAKFPEHSQIPPSPPAVSTGVPLCRPAYQTHGLRPVFLNKNSLRSTF